MRAAQPDALLRLFADKQQRTVRDRVGVFLNAAKEALARDDVVAAAGHYRLAAQCTSDPAVHAALADASGKAQVRIHAASLAQARLAESAGRWSEAAAKYARAHDIQPEASIAERAANAMRQDGKELKRAAQLAEQAVLAEPRNAAFRVTLGEIYCDAGLMNRAAGESGRASALAPGDVRVRGLASRVANLKGG
jgi:tetratricopeptide (TPR) repeat protein